MFDESPAYDPASNSVVFIRDGDVWVLTLDTLTEKRIQERAPDGGQLVGPFLVFARDDQIWAARYDRSRAETTSKAALVEPVFYVVFSSNGDALLLREDPAAYLRTLVIVDAAGVETAVGGLEPGNYRSPAFSPDGRTIAYAKGRGREPPDLFTIDLDTERRTRITNDADRHHWLPVWSPDGKEILYTQYDIDTDRESLVVQRLGQGTARTVLADRRAARASVWLRDGRAMFVDSNRVLDLRSMALADPDARPVDVIASDFNENRLSVSPSGRWIAYVGDQSGWPEIYVRPFPPDDDDAVVQISRDVGNAQNAAPIGGLTPRWSRTEEQTLYYRRGNELVRVELNFGEEVSVGQETTLFTEASYAYTAGGHNFDVSPTGEFVFVKNLQEQPMPAVVVTNWIEQLHQLLPPDE